MSRAGEQQGPWCSAGRVCAAMLTCVGVALTLGCSGSPPRPSAGGASTPTSASAPVSFARPATYPTGGTPGSIALGDLNSDGKPDVVTTTEKTVAVLLNKGGGRFWPEHHYGAGDEPRSVSLGDLNGDGSLDVVIASEFDGVISVFLNNGHGILGAKTDYRFSEPNSLAIADLDGDGTPDVAVAGYEGISAFFNDGKGRLQRRRDYPIQGGVSAVAVGDLSGDGRRDLVRTSGGKLAVLLNDGDGSFPTVRSYEAEAPVSSVVIGDVDGDGKPDVVTWDAYKSGVFVLLNRGDGTLETARRYATRGDASSLAIADLNGDGRPDLVTPDTRLDRVSVLLNSGNGSFRPGREYRTGASPQFVVAGDLNGDASPDVVTTNSTDSLFVADALFVLLNTKAAHTPPARAAARPHGTIVFASNRGGNFQVHTIRADGSRRGQLTRNDARTTAPVFSPDGRLIAFLRGPEYSAMELWVMNADGSGQRKVGRIELGTATNGSALSGPSWSPDSQRIAYESAYVESTDSHPLAIVGSDGRRTVVVPRGRNHNPSWSPDGTQLAFAREVGDTRNDLMVVGADGRGLRTVLRGVQGPALWSPAGSLIAFTTAHGLHVVSPDGRGARRVAWRADAFAWSPDGRRIGFVVAGRLYVVRVTGGAVRDITPDSAGRLSAPAWSPDGRWLAVRSVRPDARPGTGDLFVVAADGSAARRLAVGESYPFSADNQAPGWRPRGATPARLGPAPVPPSPSETASRSALQSVGPITALAADGGRVAVAVGSAASDCSHISVWGPGSHPIHLGLQLPTCTEEGYPEEQVALAGKRVAWVELTNVSVGNTGSHEDHVLEVASTGNPAAAGAIVGIGSIEGSGADEGRFDSGSDLGLVHGGGDLLAYNTSKFCEVSDPACKTGEPWLGRRVSDERLWRIEGSRRVEVRSGGGSFAATDVDAGRIAVLEPGGAVDVVRADGTLVHRLDLPDGLALSAQLSGSQLAVLTASELRAYDAGTGAPAATVPLAQAARRTLADFDHGIAVYVEGRTVHAVRLADGRRTALALPGKGAVFAQLQPSGLFTGYTLGRGKRPGRVDFMARAKLERTLR